MPSTQRKTRQTEQAYRREADSIIERAKAFYGLPDAPCHPVTAVNYLLQVAPTLRPATIRLYRSSLRYLFEKHLEEGGDVTAYEEALTKLDTVCPVTRRSDLPLRTSAGKKKSIDVDDLLKLSDAMRATPAFWPVRALRWLQASIVTGLRPIEWKDVQWLGDPSEGKLLVMNAKHTNGRAHGISRIIEIDPDHWLAATVKLHMQHLAEWKSQERSTYEMYYTNCRKALQRSVRELWPNRTRHISLYTGRHQFTANMKSKGIDVYTLAYLMGHNSEDTVQEHYGKRRSGWNKFSPRPLEAQIEYRRNEVKP